MWLDHQDGRTHWWLTTVEDRQWKAACGLVAHPDSLTDPEDEYGRHDTCLLALGTQVADRLPPGQEWR